MITKQSYQIQGMRQDNLVNTGFSSKFAHEIKNMRFNTIGDYTTASWTTEKGTKKVVVKPAPMNNISYHWITNKKYTVTSPQSGTITYNYEAKDFQPIGQAVINDNWIVFGIVNNKKFPLMSDPVKYDVILSLSYNYPTLDTEETLYGRILYWGSLNFDVEHPIETITFYENELIQKVYWTDGINQPRVINIKGAENLIDGFDPTNTTQFDFVQEVSLNEVVEITKNSSGAGLFPPCTVKYAITYYHKYGQETNIVYDSPLYYPIKGNRGCSPDELSGDSFEIKVTNPDLSHGFDYIRLYSIIRTSENATPIVRIIADKDLHNEVYTDETTQDKYVTFIDTNTTGEIIDPSILQYVGGWGISAETFTYKDNTLFLGNISLNKKSVEEALEKEGINKTVFSQNVSFSTDNTNLDEQYKKVVVASKIPQREQVGFSNNLDYHNQLIKGNSFKIKTFKYGESYRLGIQFQDKFGKWSEVIHVKDVINNQRPIEQVSTEEHAYNLAHIECVIPNGIRQKLVNKNYYKARLVCCYTNNADRKIILQGVINPTVYNVGENNDNVINAMASWFFRPRGQNADTPNYTLNKILPWKHNENLTVSGRSNSEIQSLSTRTDGSRIDKNGTSGGYNNDNTGAYKVSNQILTLNSPELDFDESLLTLSLTDCNINIVGKFNINKYISKYYVDAGAVGIAVNDTDQGKQVESVGTGFINKAALRNNYYGGTLITYCGTHDINAGYWDDIDVYENKPWRCGYPLYPFQRQGSLNNYMGDYDGTTESAKLNSKVFASLLYSDYINEYLNTQLKLNPIDFNIYDATENIPIRINNKTYYGNMNSIVPLSNEDDLTINKNSGDDTIYGHYKLYQYYQQDKYDIYKKPRTSILYENDRWWDNAGGTGSNDGAGGVSSNPIPLTYKSTRHGVFAIDATLLNDTADSNKQPFMYLVEMIRKNISTESLFGGTNNENNIYLPCGPTADLRVNNSDITVYGLEGDHYFMRYDCLKTYPYTTEDINQIVEVLSFMCESRINLDGRYDKNRLLLDNTTVTNTNFNLINKSYTQSNNLFSFTTLDQLSSKLNKFSNQITWTSKKVSGDKIDAWTNITLASTADAEGTLGSIVKMTTFNDRLVLFQDHGIAQIQYNENTAISTENGVPLELAKTGKFTGLNYISKEIGCQNKWSINQSKNGLFWIDDSRQEMFRLGEGLTQFTPLQGFDAYMIQQLPKNFKVWNPESFENFVTYYDKLSNDIYYINADTCLAWNELTQTFTSFYSYNNVPYMTNLGSHSLIWNKGVWAARESEEYSKFFDSIEDYWMTIICDGQIDKGNAFSADKVFNNIEYRADIYNLDGTHVNYSNSVFNKKHVWNGYQDSQECSLEGVRKFNTWRIQLPRHHGTRDRIRNPFCYIKLKQDNTSLGIPRQTDRIILHDLAVYFDIR